MEIFNYTTTTVIVLSWWKITRVVMFFSLLAVIITFFVCLSAIQQILTVVVLLQLPVLTHVWDNNMRTGTMEFCWRKINKHQSLITCFITFAPQVQNIVVLSPRSNLPKWRYWWWCNILVVDNTCLQPHHILLLISEMGGRYYQLENK